MDEKQIPAATRFVYHLDIDYEREKTGRRDIRVTHDVVASDQLMYRTVHEWRGLPVEMFDGILAVLAKDGVKEESWATDNFADIIKAWVKDSKAIVRIAEMGGIFIPRYNAAVGDRKFKGKVPFKYISDAA